MATKAIGTLGNIDTITVGGRVFTDLSSNLVVLTTQTTNSGNYSSFRQLNVSTPPSAGYIVPSGKTFTLLALQMWTNTGPASLILWQGGTTDVGFNGASPPTGGGFAGGGDLLFQLQASSTNIYNKIEVATVVPFAQNTYPTIHAEGGVSATVTLFAWGYTL